MHIAGCSRKITSSRPTGLHSEMWSVKGKGKTKQKKYPISLSVVIARKLEATQVFTEKTATVQHMCAKRPLRAEAGTAPK